MYGTKIGMVYPGDAVVKNLHVRSGVARDTCSIPGSGRWGRKWQSTQQSCLQNFSHRESWHAIIFGVAKSQT